MSLGGNYYGLVVVDNYSHFTWTLFIAIKDEAYHAFKDLPKLSRMREIIAFLPLSQIMVVSSRMRDLTNYMVNLGSSTIFQHQRLHNEWSGGEEE